MTIGLVSLGAGLVSLGSLVGLSWLFFTGHFYGGNALCDRLWSEVGFIGSKCCGRDVEVGYVIYCYGYLQLPSAFLVVVLRMRDVFLYLYVSLFIAVASGDLDMKSR